MGLYGIGFLIFCVVLACLILICTLTNILTEYGIGLLIGILVIGIIGYDIWEDFQFREMMREIDQACSDMEKQILLSKLMKYFGTQP
jgi:hypothetical protein